MARVISPYATHEERSGKPIDGIMHGRGGTALSRGSGRRYSLADSQRLLASFIAEDPVSRCSLEPPDRTAPPDRMACGALSGFLATLGRKYKVARMVDKSQRQKTQRRRDRGRSWRASAKSSLTTDAAE